MVANNDLEDIRFSITFHSGQNVKSLDLVKIGIWFLYAFNIYFSNKAVLFALRVWLQDFLYEYAFNIYFTNRALIFTLRIGL